MSDLVTLPERSTAVQVFSAANGLDPFLAKIREEIDGFIPDVSTAKGRKEIASIAYKVAQSKTALDNLGKELVAELKDVPKKIDAERKRMRDLLDQWKDEVRQPLTEYEEAEAKIKQEKEDWIVGLRIETSDMQELPSQDIALKIAVLDGVVIDSEWLGEYEAEAHRVKAETLQSLKNLQANAVKREMQQLELERLRKEAAEREARIAREAEERARREAEEAARQQQQEAMRREAEAKANAERAERERVEAVERQRQAEQRAEAERLAAEERAKQAAEQARQQEIQRQQAEQQRIENEQRQREQDRAHRASINNQILDDLRQQGLTEECAKTAIRAIASGNVRNVKISY